MSDPIDNVEWIPARKIKPNHWNPNFVFGPEMKLLEESIMRSGWVHPLIVNKNLLLIDGFHRYKLSLESDKIKEKYFEEVPIVKLDISDDEAMMMTVRINRAKGTHTAFRMSDLVQTLVDDFGLSYKEISTGIGASANEVDLLYKGGVFKKRDLDHWEYSKAWIPIEVSNDAEINMSFERDESIAEDSTSS
jgi:ParB-like chromosome segregation protein Spo0J